MFQVLSLHKVITMLVTFILATVPRSVFCIISLQYSNCFCLSHFFANLSTRNLSPSMAPSQSLSLCPSNAKLWHRKWNKKCATANHSLRLKRKFVHKYEIHFRNGQYVLSNIFHHFKMPIYIIILFGILL